MARVARVAALLGVAGGSLVGGWALYNASGGEEATLDSPTPEPVHSARLERKAPEPGPGLATALAASAPEPPRAAGKAARQDRGAAVADKALLRATGSAHNRAVGDLFASGTGAGGGGVGGLNGSSVGYGYGVGALGVRSAGGGTAAGSSTLGVGKVGTRGRGAIMKAAVPRAYVGGEDGAEASGSEQHRNPGVNGMVETAEDRLSTFAVDVDTASYTFARRKITEGSLPTRDAVRVEEFINYFHYDYPAPTGGAPLAVQMDAAPSPFSRDRHLLRVGVQGRRLSVHERKPAHLVFLVDVSGSMSGPDRLPLAKRALKMLVDTLRDGDTVAMVTYAGRVRVALPSVGIGQRSAIHAAIDALDAGGSTAMASGIELAYREAARTLGPGSNTRVIILSDGDANVGPTGPAQTLKLIEGHVSEGITVTTVGFGMGNYKDEMMEQFANKGNGNYYYVDSLMQARRVFQEQVGGTLEVIAQDVKLQVEFDPAQVLRYRLVGYENRDVADRDFRNDRVDAGEIGAGHSVTALYELQLAPGAGEGLCTVRVRAKRPRAEQATEAAWRFPADAMSSTFESAPVDLRFVTAVAGSAEIFRRSPWAEAWSMEEVRRIAAGSTRGQADREEFVKLVDAARSLARPLAVR